MPTNDTNDTNVYIDLKTLRALANLRVDAIALTAYEHRERVFVSPSVGAKLTGRSASAIRRACDRGDLAFRGKSHRWISVGELERWSGLFAFDAVAAALDDVTVDINPNTGEGFADPRRAGPALLLGEIMGQL